MIFLFMKPHFLRRVWQISWPTVVYSLLDTVVGMVDIYLAGMIGPRAVASIGFANQIILVLMITTISITTGTITLIAQYAGGKRHDLASSVAFHSLLLAVIAGVGIGFIGYTFAQPILLLLGAAPDVVEMGTDYLQVMMAGVIFMMINYSTNAVFRALGDTKTPLKIALYINILNPVSSYMFMFGVWGLPALGIQGIALGTVLARAIGALVALVILARPSRDVRVHRRMPFRKDIIYDILQIGLPTGFSGFFRNGARILFFAIIAATDAGTKAVAAATIGFQIRMVSIMPALAFQVATSALVGQSIGARRIEEAEEYGWTSIKLCSAIMAVTSIIVFFFPETLVSFFADSPDVIALSSITMRMIALEQFFNCVSIVVSGALAGAGDTKPFMRYTIIAQWLIMLPLAFILANLTPHDLTGAWLAWGFAPLVQMIMTIMRYMSGHWKTLRITPRK